MSFRPSIFALFASVLLGSAAHAQVVSESFKNSTFDEVGWVVSGNTYTPNLTSGGADPVADGWLRLTSTGGNQATSAYLDTSFTAAGATVYASFEYATWGGNGADGMTFFLFDGSVSFAVGAPGGSLGYANRNAEVGMAGGYIGVGIDEYGNFSSSSEGKTGGLSGGLTPDAIAVRGSEASGYAFLGSSGTLPTSIDTPGVGTRPVITNQVQILLTATNQLTVTLQQGGVNPQTVLQMDLSAYTRPETLKLGFAGSTGGLNNVHEIRNVEASTIVASLWNNQGDSTWGNNNNWNPTVVPTDGSDILFDNTFVSTDQTIDLVADREVRSITFDAPHDYTLNDNTLTFDNQGVAGFSGIAASQTRGTGDHTINSDLVANNDITIRNNNGGALTLTGDLDLNSNDVTFDGTGALTSDSGVISGTGGVIKNDSGTVTLSGANTFSGGTSINNGTLNANDDDALGTASVALAGGTLGSTNGSSVSNSISITGDAGLSGITTTGTITQTGDRTIGLNDTTIAGNYNIGGNEFTTNVGTDSTISGIISNGSLTKDGSGTLTISGANTYAGDTTVNTGTLALGGNNVISDSSDVLLGSNGTLNLNGFSERIDDLEVLAGGATLDFGSTSGANEFLFDTYTAPPSGVLVINNWEDGTDQFATTINGQDVSTMYLSGFGVAEQVGSQVAVGSLGNGYLITPIAVQFKEWDGSSNDIWNTTNDNNWTAPGEPTTTQVALFGDLGTAQPDVDLTASDTIAGIRFDTDATANYDITSTTSDITLAGTVPYIQQFSDADQRLGFDDLFLQNNTVVDITGAGDLTINADIKDSGGSQALIRDGTGTGKLILDFNYATYSGGLFVNNGIVQARDDQSLGTGTANIADGATLEFSGSLGTIDQNINVTGSGVGDFGALRNVSGTSTLSATVTATGDTKITADSGATSNYTGNITGSNVDLTFGGDGALNIDQITTGSGTVTVEAGTTTFQSGDANTYTGLTSVTGGTLSLNKTDGVVAIGAGGASISGTGTLELDSNNQINDAAAVTLADTATFDVNGYAERISQIDSSDANTVIALGTGGDLTVGAASVIYSNYEGKITGDATSTFNVDGLGTVYLAGDNSGMAGTINVDSGTLNVRGNDGVLGTGDVVVDSGASLQIQGGISTNPSDVTLGGTGTTGNGALQNIAGNNRIAGDFTLTADTTIASNSGTLNLGANFNGSVYEAGNQFALGANDLTIDGAGDTVLKADLTGTGNLIKDGDGQFTMANGTNSFTGTTTINDGEMVLATYFNDAPGVGPLADFGINGPIVIGDGTEAAGTAKLTLGTADAGAGNFNNMLAGDVDVTINSDGRLDTRGHTTYVRDIDIDGGSINAQTGAAGGNNLFVTGDITSTSTTQVATIDGYVDFNADADQSINVVTGSTLDINARIQNGGIDKTGDGTLILSGGNTFTDDVDVLDGIVRVDNNLGLGSVTGGTNVTSGAQLQLDGVSVGAEALTINGTGISGDGALQTIASSGANSWAGNVTVGPTSEIEVSAASSLAITGNVTGSGQTLTIESIGDTTLSGTNTLNTLNKTGVGNLTVTTSPNTISTVNVDAGTFTVGTSNILHDSLDLNVNAAGTFAMAGGIVDTIDQFNSSGTLDIDGILTMNGGTISGGSGAGSTGEMILTANNTLNITSDYDFGGTLELTADTTLALSGNGNQIDIGTLKVTGDTVIDFGAGENIELNLGSLEITAGSTITVNNWNQFQDLWTTGSFTGGTGGVTIDERDGNTAQITFSGFSPSDTIWLTFDYGSNEITVPEPSSYGALLMTFGLAAWTLRRPRRSASGV